MPKGGDIPLHDWLAAFDLAALHAVTRAMHWLAGGHQLALAWATRLVLDTDGLKLGVPVMLALYVWLRPEGGYRADPVRVLRGVAGVMLTLALGRMAQDLLPPRPRPRIALPDFPFPPLGHLSDMADWSSMPSDHAALAFALAAVAWVGSWRLGLLSMAWAAFITCLPRLYFGYHYASDLVAGAALGLVTTAMALRLALPQRLTTGARNGMRRFDRRAPTLLLLAFFLLGFECLTQFRLVRVMGSAVSAVVQVASGNGAALAEAPSGPTPRVVVAPAARSE